MQKTVTVYHRDGRARTIDINEASRLVGAGTVGAGRDWSFVKPPPLNWERQIPKYLVTRDVSPPIRARYRAESPFTTIADDSWQYSERTYQRGEEIETTEWPHPSFRPMNYSAERVLQFFNLETRSRLTRSPWHNGRVRLDNGLTNMHEISVTPPQPRPMNLRPVA